MDKQYRKIESVDEIHVGMEVYFTGTYGSNPSNRGSVIRKIYIEDGQKKVRYADGGWDLLITIPKLYVTTNKPKTAETSTSVKSKYKF